jgi:hypothetical protein
MVRGNLVPSDHAVLEVIKRVMMPANIIPNPAEKCVTQQCSFWDPHCNVSVQQYQVVQVDAQRLFRRKQGREGGRGRGRGEGEVNMQQQ